MDADATTGDNGELEEEQEYISRLRRRNAVGFWISGNDGTEIEDCLQLSNVSIEHPIGEWLDPTQSTTLHWFHIACPTRISRHREAKCETGSFVNLSDEMYRKSVKPAHTAFGVVHYDQSTDSTVVICRPFTGRSHQIRMHLQILGHSIVNDVKYGGEEPPICKEAREKLDELDAANETLREGLLREDNEPLNDFVERTCVTCIQSRQKCGTNREMLEFLATSQGICLHALQLTMKDSEGKRHCFRTTEPTWSQN